LPTATEEKRGPGRPSTGARDRVLEAGLETLLEEGYAGLSYAKVAEKAGENKSLISYYFGSKQGLVGEVAQQVGSRITEAVVLELGEPESVRQIASGMISGLWKVMDEDKRIARLYFDLSAVSVVDDEIRLALQKVKAQWREVITGDLAQVGVPTGEVEALEAFLLAGVQGLGIERLSAETPEDFARLDAARDMFIRAADSLSD
jgi:AcrR family transcriptional regulator